jgi:hypothetical protein
VETRDNRVISRYGVHLKEWTEMTRWSRFNIFGSARKAISVPNTLSGYFELRVNRIVGWSKDGYGSDAATMQIEVFVRGGLIASFAATKQPEQQRFVFSFPVDGRFTTVELVREDVLIMARDSDGNNGRILLDGAAQIELARETLGVPATVIFDLEFSRGGNARPYLGAGWSGEEAEYTWTENDDSFISFDTPTDSGAYALRMTAGAAVRRPERPTQDLEVFIDTTQVADIVYYFAHVQFNECKFAHDVFAGEPRTTLRLHHPGAVRPSDMGPSTDRRRVAFSFKRLTLIRLLQPQ